MRVGKLSWVVLQASLWLLGLPLTLLAQPVEGSQLFFVQDSSAILKQIETGRMLRASQPDTAASLLLDALKQSRLAGYSKGIRSALLSLAQLHYHNNQFEAAIKAAQALLENSDSIKTRDSYCYAYAGLALAYLQLDRYDDAFEAYRRALLFLPDTNSLAMEIYNNMGELLHRIGEGEKALTYYKRAIAWQQQYKLDSRNAFSALVDAYSSMGSIYSYTGDLTASESCFAKAIELTQEHGLHSDLYTVKRLQAFMYNNHKMPRAALSAIKEARNLLEQHPMPSRISVPSQLDMAEGDAYVLLGQYPPAAHFLEKALAGTDSSDASERSIISYKLSTVFDSLGDYEQAYRFVTYAYQLSEQVKNKEIQSRLNEANIRYQTVEKNSELARKDMLLSNYQRDIAQKNLLITSVSLGLIIVLLLFWNARRHYQRRKRLLQQEQEIGQLKAVMTGEEKERVRLARELHDGVGSMLATIKLNVGSIQHINRDAAVSARLEAVTTMLQETSSEVRTAAHNLVPDALSKYGISEAILQYIQRLDAQHDIRITLHMPAPLPDLSKTVELVLYRMVQELIQNVLKHASATQIIVQLLAYENTVSLSVEDNGKGMTTEADTASGFGLDNLRYRVQALHGEMSIDSLSGEGTIVHISFRPDQLE